jgi:four helix bundle protein
MFGALALLVSGARHFEELVVWQLSDQLRVEIFKLTGRSAFARDYKLHSQTEDAINSVCRNISEGFGGSHAEFARYVRISRRSLNEVQDAFRAARLKEYVTDADLVGPYRLMRRIYPAMGRLIDYLDRTPDPPKKPSRRSPSQADRKKGDRNRHR